MSVATIKIISFSSQMITSFPCLRASQFWRQWQILFPPLLWIAPAPAGILPQRTDLRPGGNWWWMASIGGMVSILRFHIGCGRASLLGAEPISTLRAEHSTGRGVREISVLEDGFSGGWHLCSVWILILDSVFGGLWRLTVYLWSAGLQVKVWECLDTLFSRLPLDKFLSVSFLFFCPWGDIFQWHWRLKLPHNNNISYNVHIVLCQEGYR